MRRLPTLAITVCLVGCYDEVEKPVPPDMSALVAAYEAPSGTFDDVTVAEVVDYIDGLDDAFALALPDEIRNMFSGLSGSVAEPEAQPASEVETANGVITIEGDAFVILTRICDGWLDPPVADAANGHLALNANFTDISIDPVVWLTTSACRYTGDQATIEIVAGPRSDVGDIRLYIGPGVTADNLADRAYIVDVEVEASIDLGLGPVDSSIDVDFSFDPVTEQLSVRVPTSSGDIIATTTTDKDLLGVEAANGDFSCDPTDRSCTGDNGDVVTF